MKSVMGKSAFREIKNSLSRWFAIMAIIALGVGFFSGLKVCKESFWLTGDIFLRDHVFFDYELLSTIGLDEESLDYIKDVDGVASAEGAYSSDALIRISSDQVSSPSDRGDKSENSSEIAVKLHSISDEINTLKLMAGSMPKAPNECLADNSRFSHEYIGKTVTISSSNDKNTRDMLAYDTYTITGLVESPLYLNFERGSTSLGDGTVSGFFYIPEQGWDAPCYSKIYLTLKEGGPIFSEEYKANVKSMEKPLKDALTTCGEMRYTKVIDEAKEELTQAEDKLHDARIKLADGEKKLAENERKLSDARGEIRKGEKDIATNRDKIKAEKENLKKAQAQLDEGRLEYDNSLKAFEDQKAAAYQQLEPLKAVLEKAENTPAYQTYLAQYNAAKENIDMQLAPAEAKLSQAVKELKENQAKIDAGYSQIKEGEEQLAKAVVTLNNSKEELAQGEKKLEKARADLEKGSRKLQDAEKELRAAKKEVAKIESPDTYLLGRDTNIGYVCFENDTNIVDGIAKVFPAFFLLVAALVVMTTMTRMMDEHRTQIGVLKALGYSKRDILLKYVFYSGSGALLGGAFGFFVGSHLFPLAIWKAYSIMYHFSDLTFVVNPLLGTFSILVALVCAVGTTVYSCYEQLSEVPAQLIRPKAPAMGKRILLERFTFIWKRLSFLHKVTARNIFRYKKRFFMMVVGISGCTALLVTGLGISDSIKDVVSTQYDEIMYADYIATFDKGLKEGDQQLFMEENQGLVSDALFAYTVSMDVHHKGQIKSVNLVVCDEKAPIGKFIDLHDEKKNPLSFPKEGDCIINSNLGLRLGLKVGDTITVQDSDMNKISARISAMCENFVFNYMYISIPTYEAQQGPYEINSAFLLGVPDASGKVENPGAQGAKIMESSHVSSVSVSEDFRARISNMMKSLDYIILLVVACAGALAFIVLYNLTNINITERIREIATIKVLGFKRGETSSYVFRENGVLTVIGALVGLPLGKALQLFVMSQIVVDMVSFDIHIEPLSYLLSVVITFGFSALVSLIMLFKLEKINMAESLKSVE